MINLPPSNAARRVACPGSRKLESEYPKTKSEEGILAHEIAAGYLSNYKRVAGEYPFFPKDNHTPEMIEGAIVYHDYVAQYYQERSVYLHVEAPVDISVIHPECRGIVDAWFYDSANLQLHIFEYKFGHGFIEVYENWQLIEYAAGILEQLRITGYDDQYISVFMHIVQPRSFHPSGPTRSWKITASDLRPYFNILRSAEYESMSDYPMARPSSQCLYCRASHSCVALQQASMVATDVTTFATNHKLSPIEVASELRTLEHAAELLDARISGLQAQALSLIQSGKSLPFYTAEHGKGKRQWKFPVEQMIDIAETLDLDIVKPPELVTPLQANLTPELLEAFSEMRYGEMKLIPIDTTKLRKIFS